MKRYIPPFNIYITALLFLSLSLAASAYAQSSINGYVSDAASGETLLMANVILAGTSTGVATNTLGYYTLSGLEAGTYEIIYSYIGYKSLRKEVTLADGEQLRLDIKLQEEAVMTQGVTITAEREDEEERLQLGVSRMPVRMVTQLPAMFEADLFRSLQMLPGIKAASDFSSGLIIRGGSPDQTLVVLDRTTLYNPSHFFGLFSTFNPDAIKDVQIYKGNYPSRFGGRLGSVVDVYNKDGNRETMQGKVSLGMLASRISLEGPLQKGSWMVAARRSTVEPILAALRETEEGIPDTFYFYDVNAKLNFDASKKDRFSLGVYTGKDKLVMSPVEDFDIDLPYGNRAANLTWTHIFSPDLFANFTVTGSQYFNLPEINIGGSKFTRTNTIDEYAFRADLEYVAGKKHVFEGGFKGSELRFKLQDRGEGEGNFDLRTNTFYGTAYLQNTWKPSPFWTIKTGAHLQVFSISDHTSVEPRIAIEHQPNPSLRFQAAYGRYHQFFSLASFYSNSALDIWLASGRGVQPSEGDQYGLGVKKLFAGGYRLDAEVYYRTMRNLFELDPRVLDPVGLEYRDYFHFGEGYAYGLELLLEKSEGDLTGFVGYTYGDTRRKFADTNQGDYYPLRYDRTHEWNAVMNYRLSPTWGLTTAFSYATGQPYTRALGRAQYDDPFTSGAVDQVVAGRVNASRLPGYHRLDVGFTRYGRFFKFGESELQIQVVNAYNRRNIWFYEYDLDVNPVAIDPVRMLPLLPNISYTVSF
ncbi:MAG: TonB-dependent receptor [Rhodothermaceae bacterium]|nr:TonB-dependent receptor [Rhodothermaceae bacterium]